MTKTIKLYPNPGLFFQLNSHKIIAVDPLRQEEFELEEDYFNRLKFWDGLNEDTLTPIDEELLEGNLIYETPFNHYPWKGDRSSFLFHLATRTHESMTPHQSEDQILEAFVQMSNAKGEVLPRPQSQQILETITLPDPEVTHFEKESFFQAVKKRKTSRNFNNTSISLTHLSDLLYLGFGYIHGHKWSELQDLAVNFSSERKSSPSGSGLQACEAYITVNNVEDLEAGFYRYCPHSHSLDLLSKGCDGEMHSYLLCDQFWIKETACGIFITVDMERVWHKSDFSRAYAYVFLEAGHISQTLLLGATALGLNTWLSGSMRDGFIAEKFQVDGYRSFPVSSVFIGHGSEEAVPRKFKELALKKQSE